MTHRQEPHARLVKIIPTTVPKPFGLSKARPKLTDLTSAITKDHRAEELHIHRDSKPALRGPMTTVELPILDGHVPTTRGKRKFSEAQQQEVAGMSSPAKRIKVQHDQTRPILPARGQTSRLKHQSIVPSFEPPSAKMYKRTAEQTGSRFLRQAAGGERAREADIVGVVPRTVYSPEKQFRINKVASPTKPQPFKFSTEARAGRSPAVRRPLQDGPPVPRKLNSLHVPALKVAPFVPKPSDHPATIAASPARKLPSRLQTRREFDKVAEKHAEEVVQKRRREEELLAAERERRMNERRGWQDSGRAAIEQWAAARAKITSDGKRAWID
ncbi:protein of unknown function [Taphrina deformans PYCC 5710]|uniref:Uncharacterized protein n=1 Tax=Taphrina deformans (strain PYCC 5710 / ATCC 11124 / CBS 356.35 / IMI 108563 / JCM 9778 / NBRC 8474) TaxID=1097556 RepID=R4XGN5_TAPDE|nr:protein of unknown function [Taphrina deformans PYCC 5710]|eukprot:CCG85057.1 protein of unknown function [Taphrina deformans PYCC 5710]